VTKGNNTVSFSQGGKNVTVTGFNARRGYDLASGGARSTPSCSCPSWRSSSTTAPGD